MSQPIDQSKSPKQGLRKDRSTTHEKAEMSVNSKLHVAFSPISGETRGRENSANHISPANSVMNEMGVHGLLPRSTTASPIIGAQPMSAKTFMTNINGGFNRKMESSAHENIVVANGQFVMGPSLGKGAFGQVFGGFYVFSCRGLGRF